MNPAPEPKRQSQVIATEQMAPSPLKFFEAIRAFEQSAALKVALDLDLFTAVAEGAETVDAIARRTSAATRGVRILCDYLTTLGFLTKEDGRYGLTHDTFVFLNRHSPAYIGSIADFLFAGDHLEAFRDLTTTVRRGTRDGASLVPDNPMWVTFARKMAPLASLLAGNLADLLDVGHAGPIRVLDIATGHGLYGIAVARQNQAAEIVGVDWAPVLEVARENAQAAGVAARFRTIAGDARKIDVGKDYDLVLVTNFLHHFDRADCVAFLKRMHGALRDGGRLAALEFVPNDDRVTPPAVAAFALTMLAMTPSGDAYTFGELDRMFGEAGFRDVALHALPPAMQSVVTAVR